MPGNCWNVTYVVRVVIHGTGLLSPSKYRHSGTSVDVVLPLGVGMPMEFTQSAWLDTEQRSCNGFSNMEMHRIRDAHIPARALREQCYGLMWDV